MAERAVSVALDGARHAHAERTIAMSPSGTEVKVRTLFDLLKVLRVVHAFDGDAAARVEVVVVCGVLEVPLSELVLVQPSQELVEDVEVTLALDLVHHPVESHERESARCVRAW
jgi:hypothetical protein